MTLIEKHFGEELAGAASRIQLWIHSTAKNILIEELSEIPDEYYLEPNSGGLHLNVVLLPSPTSSRQVSGNSLVTGMG